MPDSTLSQAIKEAYASATDEIIYHTLEINHSAFSTPIRVVRDTENLEARLEAGAPINAGEVVTFLGFAFDLIPPDVAHTTLPQCVIEIDNVDRTILAQIDAAMVTNESITVIYRAYLSTDLDSGPENDPPLELTILSISADVFRIRAIAGFVNLLNKRFPSVEYTADVFPGLITS